VLSTAPRDHDRRQQRRVMWIRRGFSVGLAVFVVLAFLGLFGQRNASTSVEARGYELEVLYPQITRPGLSSPFELTVRRTDGGPLPETLSLGTNVDYLRLFDDQAIEPEAVEMRADGDEVQWQVLPEGDADEVTVFLDARIDPGVQWGTAGTTTLYVDGEAVASAEYRTWVLP
jgi:hypothetical protein